MAGPTAAELHANLTGRLDGAEWAPSKKEYLRIEQEVLSLMTKVHELKGAVGTLTVLWVLTCLFCGLHLLLSK